MRFLLFLFVFIQGLNGNTQENNPFNRRGVDYAASLGLIRADFDEGKVNEINEQTLAHYSQAVPLKNTITLEVATNVVQTMKRPGFDFEEFISNSPASSFSKETYLRIYRQSFNQKGEAFSEFLRQEVDAILDARADRAEKEGLLTIIAMVYHSGQARQGCTTTISGPNGVMIDESGTGCILLGMGVGFFAGNAICGLACGIGGAIVGGIVGALT